MMHILTSLTPLSDHQGPTIMTHTRVILISQQARASDLTSVMHLSWDIQKALEVSCLQQLAYVN